MTRAFALPFFGTICGFALAASAADVVVPHQGYLLDASDGPLDAPSLPLVFRLHAAETPSATPPVWESTTCAVTVSKGFYSVGLGGECDGSVSLDSSMLPPGATRWLELVVNGTTLSPRLRFSAGISALRASVADDADLLDGKDSTAFVANTGTLQAGAQFAVQQGSVAGTLTTGTISAGTMSATTAGTVDLAASGTVSGAGFAGWDRNGADDLSTSTTFGGDVTGTSGAIAIVDDSHLHGDASVSNNLSIDNGRLYAPTGAGRVGIGTTSPAAQLDVAGTDSIRIPVGTTAERPSTAVAGMVRMNSTTKSLEFYSGTAWVAVGASAAIGGTTTDVSGYRIHTFTSNNTFSVTGTLAVEVLVVAGGGGGGYQVGGGGGGGGVVYSASYVVSGSVGVTVGAGGAGATGGATAATNGGNSVFGTLTAFGGGAGANHDRSAGGYLGAGQPGGSGGGGAGDNASVGGPGGAGTPGQGFNGGAGRATSWAGGGGGGAGGAGQSSPSASVGGTGGIGYQSSISGTATYYGGGGGGCNNSSPTLVAGGLGGGGAGTGDGNNNPTQRNGVANTGGGGGGVRDTSGSGGNGGSGIVIVRYPL